MRTARLRSTGLAVLAALLLSLLLVPTRAMASGIRVTENAVEHSFAQHVTFSLEASSDAEIREVYLFFRATHDEKTERKRITLEHPSQEISLRVTHDARRYPLPPFAHISYWWQIEDISGNSLKTSPKQFTYRDNRFEWEQIAAEGIRIHWIAGQGDPAFAQAALDIAQASVKDIEADLRGPVPNPLDVFIYDSEANLQAAMVLTGREWVGGQARPELGVVVIAVPPENGYTSRMSRYLPHEITHLLVYALTTPAGYVHVPTWLNEGLSTANERLPTPEHALALEEAREAGELVPLEELCVPFSPDSSRATLSYAQSASVVNFIRDEYGTEGIRKLLAAYADGASCKSGVQEALETSFSKLESNWRMSIEPTAQWLALMDKIGVWVALWLLGLLLAVPMLGELRRRSKDQASESPVVDEGRVSR